MDICIKPMYKRILLKLSGEVLQGSENFGIDEIILNRTAQEIKELTKLGIQIGIVIGGGNFFRGAKLEKIGVNRIVGDHMGMLATIINGLAMCNALQHVHVNANLMSAIPLGSICNYYSWNKAIDLLHNNYVVVFSAGTGNPLFTTDSAACLRGIEIKAEAVIKATKVDGIFSKNPAKDFPSSMYKLLSYNEVLEKKISIMDLTAFTLARDYKLPIHIFNMNKPGALYRVIMGEKEGTLIKE